MLNQNLDQYPNSIASHGKLFARTMLFFSCPPPPPPKPLFLPCVSFLPSFLLGSVTKKKERALFPSQGREKEEEEEEES